MKIMINPVEQYKDPLNSNTAMLMSYSNEIGTAISEVAPKLGAALWAPTFMYLGADIYDKYKNDNDNYDPSKKRALKRAIYQGITSLVALPAVIFAGQCAVSPLGRLDKTGISGNVKDAIYKHTKSVIDQAHGTALENYESFKNIVSETLQNKINARSNEKQTLNIFKKIYRTLFTNRYDILHGDKKKIMAFAEKNAKDTFELSQALKCGNTAKIPKKISKKYEQILPKMKEMYKDGDYAFQATRTALKEYQKMKIFRNKILKTMGGFVALLIFIKPVNDFVDKQIMDKYIDPRVDNLNVPTFENFRLQKEYLWKVPSSLQVSTPQQKQS